MVRENRIKEYVFPAIGIIGSTQSAAYSDHVLNGEILKVRFEGITSPGSLWIAESGTDIEVLRKNNFTSGLAAFESYPFVYGVNSTSTTGSPQTFFNAVTNNILYVAGSGFTSGTGTEFGPITVFYR